MEATTGGANRLAPHVSKSMAGDKAEEAPGLLPCHDQKLKSMFQFHRFRAEHSNTASISWTTTCYTCRCFCSFHILKLDPCTIVADEGTPSSNKSITQNARHISIEWQMTVQHVFRL